MVLLECIFTDSIDNTVPCPTNRNVGIRRHFIRDTQLTPWPNTNNGFVVPQSGFDLIVDPLAVGDIHSRENNYAATARDSIRGPLLKLSFALSVNRILDRNRIVRPLKVAG